MRPQSAICTSAFLAVLLFVATGSANAFQVLPKVSDVDRELQQRGNNRILNWLGQWAIQSAIPMLKSPVHEAATLAALDCDYARGEEMACLDAARILEYRMILYGVRWPDDPPFRLSASQLKGSTKCDPRVTLRSTAQPQCWNSLFNDAAKRAAKHVGPDPAFGVGTMMLYRSHFGDLQFMHAMAAVNGETAGTTRDNMMWWAKVMWELAGKRLSSTDYLRDLGITELAAHFPGDMSAQNLLATGLPSARSHLDQVAIGVLLHMVQDSYSAAHAHRDEPTGAVCPGFAQALAPGRIQQFYSYVHQKGRLHDRADTEQSLSIHAIQTEPSVVDVSRTLLRSWEQGQTWDEVEPYFKCLFALKDPNIPAGPGPF